MLNHYWIQHYHTFHANQLNAKQYYNNQQMGIYKYTFYITKLMMLSQIYRKNCNSVVRKQLIKIFIQSIVYVLRSCNLFTNTKTIRHVYYFDNHYLCKQLPSKKGFILEALVEAFPQGILKHFTANI